MNFGIPKVITSDQGGEFNNRLDAKLMKLMNIDHRLTTPYHPQVKFKYFSNFEILTISIGKWPG